MAVESGKAGDLRAYLEYFRDMGIYDFYRNGPLPVLGETRLDAAQAIEPLPEAGAVGQVAAAPSMPRSAPLEGHKDFLEPAQESIIPKLVSFNDLIPLPAMRTHPAGKAAALEAVRQTIGDCTRCPLAYAGRRKIVFADGDPNARLMFIGEGPGADEDEQGVPFVGKSGQLLNNMIGAMGLKREQVYVANVVKCRPPANRAPEWIEASTCTQFLVQQMDIVQPEYVVALGLTAAQYVLGVKQSLTSLRGRFHDVRGTKLVITYHPAFLLRDPSKKGEAWKDLQMVMAAMKEGGTR